MRGPDILARSMSVPTRRGKKRAAWQYHSRSDTHSKIACWTLLFDALLECDVLRAHAESGRLGFGINYEMIGPINKTLDLVLTRVPPTRPKRSRLSFSDLVDRYGIVLDAGDRKELVALPPIMQDDDRDAVEVVVALEAKACMTEHLKSLPRLHAEILATGYLAKRSMPRCIVSSYTIVNAAASFKTPSGSSKVNRHRQPEDARRVIDMLAQAVPLARDTHNLLGYDVIGAVAIDCANTGVPVTVHDVIPARDSHVRYERMIRQLCSEYRARASA